MDGSLPGSSVHGIFQARVPESGAIACHSCVLLTALGLRCGLRNLVLQHTDSSCVWAAERTAFRSCGPGLRCSEACGTFVPWPRIKPRSPASQGRFLTTGPPGKSPKCIFDSHFPHDYSYWTVFHVFLGYSYIFLYKVFRFFACLLVSYEFLHILYIGPLLYVCFSFVDFAVFYLGNLCLHLPLGQEDNLLFSFRSFVICSFHI